MKIFNRGLTLTVTFILTISIFNSVIFVDKVKAQNNRCVPTAPVRSTNLSLNKTPDILKTFSNLSLTNNPITNVFRRIVFPRNVITEKDIQTIKVVDVNKLMSMDIAYLTDVTELPYNSIIRLPYIRPTHQEVVKIKDIQETEVILRGRVKKVTVLELPNRNYLQGKGVRLQDVTNPLSTNSNGSVDLPVIYKNSFYPTVMNTITSNADLAYFPVVSNTTKYFNQDIHTRTDKLYVLDEDNLVDYKQILTLTDDMVKNIPTTANEYINKQYIKEMLVIDKKDLATVKTVRKENISKLPVDQIFSIFPTNQEATQQPYNRPILNTKSVIREKDVQNTQVIRKGDIKTLTVVTKENIGNNPVIDIDLVTNPLETNQDGTVTLPVLNGVSAQILRPIVAVSRGVKLPVVDNNKNYVEINEVFDTYVHTVRNNEIRYIPTYDPNENIKVATLGKTTNRVLSGNEVFTNSIFTWNNSNFGTDCISTQNIQRNSIQFFNNFFRDGQPKTYLGGTGWFNQKEILERPVANFINNSHLCNKDLMWRVGSYNGLRKSFSKWQGLKLINMEPEITSIELLSGSFSAVDNSYPGVPDVTIPVQPTNPGDIVTLPVIRPIDEINLPVIRPGEVNIPVIRPIDEINLPVIRPGEVNIPVIRPIDEINLPVIRPGYNPNIEAETNNFIPLPTIRDDDFVSIPRMPNIQTATLNVNAKGPFIHKIEVGYITYDLNDNQIAPYKNIKSVICNKTKNCNVNIDWEIDIYENRKYKVVATPYNKCGETKGSYDYWLPTTDTASIVVNTLKFVDVIDSTNKPQCTNAVEPLTEGVIYLKSKNTDFAQNKFITPSKETRFDFIPRSAFPVYITGNIYSNECRNYQMFCVDNNDLSQEFEIEFPEELTKNIDVIFGETRADSWATFYNSDMYVKNINISSGCVMPFENNTFETTTLNTDTNNSFTGTLYSAESINQDIDKIINSSKNSYVENLDADINEEKESNDSWVQSFVFPNANSIEGTSKIINSVDEINENDNVYYINSDLTINNDFFYKTNGMSIVYISGNLYINNSVLPQNEESFITFVVNRNIIIGNGFGVTDYTNPAIYNPESSPNIVAGLVMLDEDGSITFIGTDDYQNNPDIPVVFEGLILSKGSVNIERDLGINNYRYPSVMVNSTQNYLSRFKELAELQNTGLETFDIQWDYVE